MRYWKIFFSIFACGLTLNAMANPTGMTVVSGSATAQQSGSQLNVNVGNALTFLNWNTFNIAAGETTSFFQPSSTSVVVNNIGDANASQIYGNLTANGMVVLMNPNGFYFGPNSFVKTGGGLIVSTAQVTPPQNNGGSWEFNGPPPLASIINYGQIQVGNGAPAYLIAEDIENHGIITAPGGNIALAAGQNVLLSERPDGRGVSVQVTLPEGSVNNDGKLIADGGTISANAKVVNQSGLVQANSVQEQNGVIELVASDQLNLGANSQIAANGDNSFSGSDGGSITLKSQNNFQDASGSTISANGGAQGGNGGSVEVSAPNILTLNSKMNANAKSGWLAGKLFLDPDNIILDQSGGDSAGSTLDLNVYSAFLGFSQIILQAKNNITIADGNFWSLSDSTGVSDGQLTLEAGNDIIFGDGAAIFDWGNWSLTMKAGVSDFSAGTVQSGAGNILLNGSSAIGLNSGSINMLAGKDIQINSGSVTTSGGGSITATAVGGSVNTGTDTGGFTYNLASSRNDILYQVDASFPGNLGGISTAAGGDVNISAGQDIVSFLPNGNLTTDAGSGAFGGGNVTLNAGHDVTGHFVVANGAGTVTAGNNAGNNSSELALSLIDGGWTVNAGQNILLQEVRNPNGIFNNLGFIGSTTKHYFDYGADDYVTLNAGNAVTLSGDGMPRNSGSFEQTIPMIFPSTLNIHAGAGGININRNLILFPSPDGSLDVTTTGGGSLVGGVPGDLTQFIMSDSGSAQYLSGASFGLSDHASTPVHINNETPVTLNISGDMDSILLSVPEAAQINVGGNMNNSRFMGQNLKSTDVTSINVTGDILNRNEFTTISVATEPDLQLLNEAVPSPLTDLFSRLLYDPATQTLTFQGRMTSAELAALENLTVPVFNHGVPETDQFGNIITTTVSILDPATALALFNATQSVPLNPATGYVLGGGGQFNFTAHNLDLGATLGIQSVGPGNNPAMANYFTRGADISVNLSGNLDMFSTTISSLNGGNVFVDAAGRVNVGSTFFIGNDQYARGIFTVADSPVTVIAGGDINVNGSRIATYDGGDITVESLYGNIDAGSGGHGSVPVEEIFVDPITRAIESYTPRISGSGILAITFPTASAGVQFPVSQNKIGNIFVEAPNGNIDTSAGGIVQISLNGIDDSSAFLAMLAGEQPILGPAGSGIGDVSFYAFDNATKTWNWEHGALQLAQVVNPKTKTSQEQIKSEPILSDQNISQFGTEIPLLGSGGSQLLDDKGNPIFQIQVLDAFGNPLLDANGNPVYLHTSLNNFQGKLFDISGNFSIGSDGEKMVMSQLFDNNGNPLLDSASQQYLVLGRSINSSASGIVAYNVYLQGSGNVSGNIFAKGNADVAAGQDVAVQLLAGGRASVSAGDSITGDITAAGGIDAGANSIDASLLTEGSIDTGGDTSGAQKGFAQGTSGDVASQGASNDATKSVATDDTQDKDKNKKETIALAKKTGRVTVVLPPKTVSEIEKPNHSL